MVWFRQTARLVARRLETGRTHQVRIHLAEIGHPVVGDRMYRPRTKTRSPIRFRRQALYTRALKFDHPFTGLAIRVEAPPRADVSKLNDDLGERTGSVEKRT